VFLFDSGGLVDSSPEAKRMIEGLPDGLSDWERLAAYLTHRFPSFRETVDALPDAGQTELSSKFGPPTSMRLERVGSALRLELSGPAVPATGTSLDGISLHALEDEARMLREVARHLPSLVWCRDGDGTLVWTNRAYLERVADAAGIGASDLIWPVNDLFDAGDEPRPGLTARLQLPPGKTGPQWYDCRTEATPTGTVHFAAPADATVKAEASLREFVQTLTKTFAHLPIGLAIFDRTRQLALFNPALIDLTMLPPDFLSARPTLYAFLDRLREARVIPEPKDYHDWREKLAALEKAAAEGLHEETWTLPGGQTYRVMGRPHPEGGLALLIEDISDETTLSRRFQSELELGQDIVDRLEEGIAVFASTGQLSLTNAPYVGIWGHDPGSTLSAFTIHDALAHWQSVSATTPLWERLLELAESDSISDSIDAAFELASGSLMRCRAVRLQGGGMMVSFRPVQTTQRLRSVSSSARTSHAVEARG
jgi:PAS domain-containing protein